MIALLIAFDCSTKVAEYNVAKIPGESECSRSVDRRTVNKLAAGGLCELGLSERFKNPFIDDLLENVVCFNIYGNRLV